MARIKTSPTFSRIVLENGNIKLSSPKGIIDIRNNIVYSEVICKPNKERYFMEAEG